LRFFYLQTLGWEQVKLSIPPRKRPSRLPEIFSRQELERLFASAAFPKHRVLLMTTYAAGLRVGEVVRLKVGDVDSQRMMIRVQECKGMKDRYTILSAGLLTELRLYWKLYGPSLWLFPSTDPSRHISIDHAQRVYYRAKQKAGIQRGRGIHTLRHCFATIVSAMIDDDLRRYTRISILVGIAFTVGGTIACLASRSRSA
jgi:integrase